MPNQLRFQASSSFLTRIFILLFIPFAVLFQPAYTQTPTASNSGLSLEKRIQGDLQSAGYEIIASKDWNEARLYQTEDPRFVILDAPYRSIYGHRARIEFLIILGDRQILVETKRQRVPGSVDEKLPFVYLNALNNLPEREFILVLDGDGFKPQAIDWIKARARETDGFSVLGPDELVEWLALSASGREN